MELELEDLSLRNNTNIVKRAATVDVDGSTESLNISSFPPVASLLVFETLCGCRLMHTIGFWISCLGVSR